MSVEEQLRALGVQAGSVLLVHTSFSSIRPIDGGPEGLIDALIDVLGPHGTLVMPSWSQEDDYLFVPEYSSCKEDLGVVADTFWRRPDVVRGNHPFAVAARGPLANEIAGAPFILPPHAPGSGVSRVHDHDGWVLLLGVDHDADTTIHLAELLGGAPYRQPNHIIVLEDGVPKRIDYGENDSCCRGFNMVGMWLHARGLQRDGTVGTGRATLVRARDVVATVVEELREDPTRFLCSPGTCEECDRSWATVPA
jgi:aminoglycoside N3'-acetyltransferase